jgi:hypothetical protein
MAALALAALWVPVSVHCQLEQVPGLEFLSCCPHEDAAPNQDDDCAGDACSVIESGLYKLEEQQASLPAPDFGDLEFASSSFDHALTPVEASCVPARGTAPPEYCRVWQFTSRTALPPRAPSFVS